MVRKSLTRRRFGVTLTSLTALGLAGCSEDEQSADEDDSESFELDDPGELTIELENGDGEPVSSGVAVTLEHAEEDYSVNYRDNIQEGRIVSSSLVHEGEYEITVESTDGEFEPVTETVTLEEEEDETVTIVLEGASGDSEGSEE